MQLRSGSRLQSPHVTWLSQLGVGLGESCVLVWTPLNQGDKMKKIDRKSRSLRPLDLRRETLVHLTGDQLKQVAGGITAGAACSTFTFEQPPEG